MNFLTKIALLMAVSVAVFQYVDADAPKDSQAPQTPQTPQASKAPQASKTPQASKGNESPIEGESSLYYELAPSDVSPLQGPLTVTMSSPDFRKIYRNKKNGCPSSVFYHYSNHWCNLQTNYPCSGRRICCPTIFGTTCALPTNIPPNPDRGCPPINPLIRCFWYNEQCNSYNKPCPYGSICCRSNCGTQCVRQHHTPYPIRCPLFDTSVRCSQRYEQCNSRQPCPRGYACCRNNCGTSCIRQY